MNDFKTKRPLRFERIKSTSSFEKKLVIVLTVNKGDKKTTVEMKKLC